jgi:hypothetical protein
MADGRFGKGYASRLDPYGRGVMADGRFPPVARSLGDTTAECIIIIISIIIIIIN